MTRQGDAGRRFREPAAAEAGGYVLALAGLVVAVSVAFHPLPAGGFREDPGILAGTPWWGLIHVLIAAGFVGCVLGGLLVLVAGGAPLRHWTSALCWGALTVGMIFFTGVALINGWVLHTLAPAAEQQPLLYEALNDLMIGYGWLGNPLFLVGLTGIAVVELRRPVLGMPRWLAGAGAVMAVLAWGRGIGSATGLFFLEPLIVANVPAFLWLGAYGLLLARAARQDTAADSP